MTTKHLYIAVSVAILTSIFSISALAEFPRTEAGHPDLSGTYDGATLTPLTRPEEFGDNRYLTKEEAERITATARAMNEAAAAASDPNRGAPPAGGDGSGGAAGNVGGYNAFWIDRGDEVFAIDGKFRTSVIIDPPNGQLPSYTPRGQQTMAALIGGVVRKNEGVAWWVDQEGPGPYDNMEQRNNAERCLASFSGAVPSIPSLYNNFKRVIQTEDTVMILIEMIHDARIVRMNGEHLPSHMRSWLGDSIGRWDGDTLVIETTNFFPNSLGYMGGTEEMYVTERLTPMEDGNLLYNFTVDDPGHWTEPWTGEYVWQASTDKVYEYACHEGNYALGNIMRGARILEQDLLEGRVGASGE